MATGLDVEALLENAAKEAHEKEAAKAKAAEKAQPAETDGRKGTGHDGPRGRDRSRDRDRRRQTRSRSRSRERGHRDADGDHKMNSPNSHESSTYSHRRSRRPSRSPNGVRNSSRHRSRSRDRGSGGYGRGGGRNRSRSRSPDRDRSSRAPGRDRRERDEIRPRDHHRERDRYGAPRGRGGYDGGSDRHNGRRRSRSPRKNKGTPEPTDDERDGRTVFVQQLAARLRTKDLIEFFTKAGPVKDAQIVKDRVSGRSKGVGYVEFKDVKSVPLAIALTGQKLLGIPIIAQLTEAEKNRIARTTTGGGQANAVPFHRLYVGNIHFSITESDLKSIFTPFGELEFVQLQKDDGGRSRGYGFVQFNDASNAREALEKMNGFILAERPIRVGLGNDKFTQESTASMMHRFQAQGGQGNQNSSFSGSGGRGANAGGSTNFDKAGGNDKASSAHASALDDTDVAGVNYNNYDRQSLMRKLARTDINDSPANTNSRGGMARPQQAARPLPVAVPQASRCIIVRNMFDAKQESEPDWIKTLEDDIKKECNKKYGTVTHISLDPNTQGDVYIKFSKVDGGEQALKGLNGRFFGGRQVTAQPVVDAVYSSLFQRASAL